MTPVRDAAYFEYFFEEIGNGNLLDIPFDLPPSAMRSSPSLEDRVSLTDSALNVSQISEKLSTLYPDADEKTIFDQIPYRLSPKEKVQVFAEVIESRMKPENSLDESIEKLFCGLLDPAVEIELLKKSIEKDPRFNKLKRTMIEKIYTSSDTHPIILNALKNLLIHTDAQMRFLHRYATRFAPNPLGQILSDDFAGVANNEVKWDGTSSQERLIQVLNTWFQGGGFEWVEPYLNSLSEDPFVHRKVIVAISNLISWIKIKQIDHATIKMLSRIGFYQKIFDTKAPNLYTPLAIIGTTLVNSRQTEHWRKELFFREEEPFKVAQWMLLPLVDKQSDFESICLNLFSGENRAIFKNASSLKLLLTVLIHLEKETTVRIEDKTKLLLALSRDKNPLEILRNLAILFEINQGATLGLLVREPGIACSLDSSVSSALSEVLALDPDKLSPTFGSCRNPLAIWQLAAIVLKSPHRHLILPCLELFIDSTISGTFYELRYDQTKNGHLNKMVPELLAKWRAPIDNQPLESSPIEEPASVLNRIFGHCKPKLEKLTPQLFAYLNAKTDADRAQLLGEVHQGPPPLDFTPEMKKWFLFEQKCMQLAIASIDNIPALHSRIQPVLNSLDRLNLPELIPVRRELEQWSNNIRLKMKRDDGLVLKDTDHWTDLLLYSTEIPDSCQSLDLSRPEALSILGTIMNGQTRLLAVADREGKLVGRALFRLLLSRDSNEPVLFLERYYGPARYKQDLLFLALEKAKQMNLPLTAFTHSRLFERYPESLLSYGGLSPFDSSDAESVDDPFASGNRSVIPMTFYVRDASFPLTGGSY